MSADDLQHAPELSNEDIERVFKTIEIPTCPTILVEVMSEAQKDMPDIKKLTRFITLDIGMSAITLKMANSPLFRTGAPIIDIRTAMERLGMRNIVSVVVAGALRSSMAGISSKFIEKFWDRSSVVAIASGLIARRQRGIAADSAYTYALFHDIGIPLMVRRFPEYMRVLEECRQSGRMLIEAEADYFPCTHPVIGALMVHSWGLPADISQAIRFHHEPDVYDLPDSILSDGAVSLIALTQIADHFASEIYGEDDLEVGSAVYDRALAHFGISGEELEQLSEDINLAIHEIH